MTILTWTGPWSAHAQPFDGGHVGRGPECIELVVRIDPLDQVAELGVLPMRHHHLHPIRETRLYAPIAHALRLPALFLPTHQLSSAVAQRLLNFNSRSVSFMFSE